MCGSGPTVFAVMGYCIAHADPDTHLVALNPTRVAPIIGTTKTDIEDAIAFLCRPDKQSRNKAHAGRRLVRRNGFTYFLVSHEYYRGLHSRDDVRRYERERKRLQREKKKGNVRDCPGHSGTTVLLCSDLSEEDKRGHGGEKKPRQRRKQAYSEAFERCWIAFGCYGVKAKAW